MGLSLDDDSVPANARVWDFVIPPKSWSTLPLSSQNSAVSGRIDLPVAIAALDQRALTKKEDRFAGGQRPPYSMGKGF